MPSRSTPSDEEAATSGERGTPNRKGRPADRRSEAGSTYGDVVPDSKSERKAEAQTYVSGDADGLTAREQRIREAAYQRWQARGEEGGHPDDDWLAAERDVDARGDA